ncbi:hypothetical protein QBC34DRAFT_382804 [Podospora aff. communis PSN243]|uniref:Uncharacterized protein n=1 Tax=Podospora aff. communis PSN243 TaxID=3040156 RepID=A0AAV9GH04_9PEZI|nr:hypothetical protein QBC34DRAFT_382804 [Podospora aff. communis PSN243]
MENPADNSDIAPPSPPQGDGMPLADQVPVDNSRMHNHPRIALEARLHQSQIGLLALINRSELELVDLLHRHRMEILVSTSLHEQEMLSLANQQELDMLASRNQRALDMQALINRHLTEMQRSRRQHEWEICAMKALTRLAMWDKRRALVEAQTPRGLSEPEILLLRHLWVVGVRYYSPGFGQSSRRRWIWLFDIADDVARERMQHDGRAQGSSCSKGQGRRKANEIDLLGSDYTMSRRDECVI